MNDGEGPLENPLCLWLYVVSYVLLAESALLDGKLNNGEFFRLTSELFVPFMNSTLNAKKISSVQLIFNYSYS